MHRTDGKDAAIAEERHALVNELQNMGRNRETAARKFFARGGFLTSNIFIRVEGEWVSFIGEQGINIRVRAKKVGRRIKIFLESSVKIDRGRETDCVGDLLVAHVGREE